MIPEKTICCVIKPLTRNESAGIEIETHGVSRKTLLFCTILLSNLSWLWALWLTECFDSAGVTQSQGTQANRERKHIKICYILTKYNVIYKMMFMGRLCGGGSISKLWALEEGYDEILKWRDFIYFKRKEYHELGHGERKVWDQKNWYFCHKWAGPGVIGNRSKGRMEVE